MEIFKCRDGRFVYGSTNTRGNNDQGGKIPALLLDSGQTKGTFIVFYLDGFMRKMIITICKFN